MCWIRALALGASLLSCLACHRPAEPRLPPEWAAALAGREKVDLEGVVYLPPEPGGTDEPDPVELRLTRLGGGTALYSFAWPEPPPGEDDGERIPIKSHLPYAIAQGGTGREPARIFELGELAITRVADLVTPSIVKIGGVEAAKAQQAVTAPVLDFAVAGLEVSGFDVYAPPEIKVFDHDSGELVHLVEFRAEIYTRGKPVVHKPRSLLVPVLLAFDADPWSHTPCARVSLEKEDGRCRRTSTET